MAKFTETVEVNCPYCEGQDMVKNGKRSGYQRFLCRPCGKSFNDTGALHGRHESPDRIGAAVRMFYSGMSYKQIAELMERMYGIPEPSKQTLYAWVREYTNRAASEMQKHPAETGADWVADEMLLDVGGEKVWNWNVLDESTRYILASHLSRNRDANAARMVMRKALAASTKPPKTIKTDKLRSYLRPIREIFPDAKHIQSEGLAAELNNNISERLQGSFRQRTKTLRGLDNLESGQRYLNGWVITYNFFKDHEGIGGRPPGELTHKVPPFEKWADVARMPRVRHRRRSTRDSPASNPPVKVETPKPKRKARAKIRPPKAGNGEKDAEAAQFALPLPAGMPAKLREPAVSRRN